MLAALDGELIEEDYDDIEEEKFSKNANKGWFGIGDKYWISSIVPPRNTEFKTTFDFKNKFRANYIATQPIELDSNSFIEQRDANHYSCKKSRCCRWLCKTIKYR